MSCTVTNDGPCLRTIRFSIDRAELDTKVEAGLRDLAPHVKLKGFRPGKVPLDVVRRTHGKQLIEEVRQRLMSDAFSACVKEHQLRVVGRPEMNLELIKEDDASGPMDFEFALEVIPDFELAEVEALQVKVELPTVDDGMVAAEIERLRRRAATLADAPEGAPIGEEDVLTVTIAYTVGDETLAPRAEKSVLVQHDLIDGVRIEGGGKTFVGGAIGDVFTLEAEELPAHFDPPQLAGKPATLVVTVDNHQVLVVPPVDEALLKRFEVDSESELAARVREQLDTQRQRVRDQQMDRSIEDQLLAGHEFELPERFVTQTIERKVHEYAHRLMEEQQMSGEDGHAQAESERERITELTRRGLKLSFVLSRLAREKELSANDEETQRQIAGLAQMQGQDPQATLEAAIQEGWVDEVRAQLTEEKVRAWLREHAAVTEIEMSNEQTSGSDAEEDAAPPSGEG